MFNLLGTHVVAFPILLFFLFGEPYKRGFFCDDESLRHPYKDSTITSAVLYVVGIGLPVAVMMVVEYVHFRSGNNHATRRFCGRNIHPWVWRCYIVIGVFGFGMACSQLTTDIAKYIIGRLRPHFFEVCNPLVNCTAPENRHNYIEKYKCQSADAHRLKEMRLSFPSGHSSFSAYTMVYLALYLQSRLVWQGSKLLRHFLQYVCIMMAIGTALSRISDYKHHWSDVLAGSLQGSFVAVVVAVHISDLFVKKKSPLVAVPESDIDPPSQSNSAGMVHGAKAYKYGKNNFARSKLEEWLELSGVQTIDKAHVMSRGLIFTP